MEPSFWFLALKLYVLDLSEMDRNVAMGSVCVGLVGLALSESDLSSLDNWVPPRLDLSALELSALEQLVLPRWHLICRGCWLKRSGLVNGFRGR
jgi:hypothetical protein